MNNYNLSKLTLINNEQISNSNDINLINNDIKLIILTKLIQMKKNQRFMMK